VAKFRPHTPFLTEKWAVIVSSVSQLKEIDGFAGCRSVYQIGIPSSSEVIKEYGFSRSSHITIPREIEIIGSSCFSWC
jgi:hypothetical protein